MQTGGRVGKCVITERGEEEEEEEEEGGGGRREEEEGRGGWPGADVREDRVGSWAAKVTAVSTSEI